MPMLDVAYEDEFLLALNKPSGLHTAPLSLGTGPGDSLLEEVIRSHPRIGGLPGRKACEPGLLHRLDRDTSGLVLFAKTEAAFAFLLGLQAEGRFLKGYQAVSKPTDLPLAGARPARGQAEGGLAEYGHIRSRFRAFGPKAARVAPIALGIDAEGPVYETRILSRRDGPRFVGLGLELVRGFRHQLRAHLAWIGLPILGDPLYASACENAEPGVGRLMLHASRLEFEHPGGKGGSLVIESSPEGCFDRLLEAR